MKSTGIVRKVDELGRVVIPKELRRVMDIGEGDGLEIYTEGDKIILVKYERGCKACGEVTDTVEILGMELCYPCRVHITEELMKQSPKGNGNAVPSGTQAKRRGRPPKSAAL